MNIVFQDCFTFTDYILIVLVKIGKIMNIILNELAPAKGDSRGKRLRVSLKDPYLMLIK